MRCINLSYLVPFATFLLLAASSGCATILPECADGFTDNDNDGEASEFRDNELTKNGWECETVSVIPGTDCNDNDRHINTTAVELCNDGVDQDCDGQLDSNDPEGCFVLEEYDSGDSEESSFDSGI